MDLLISENSLSKMTVEDYQVGGTTMSGLIDERFISTRITVDDSWCSSHGSGEGQTELGAGILYYGLAYALRAKTCVCLGSGGGFVPRLMRQAQRDLGIAESRTILVDGAQKVTQDKRAIWGSPDWLSEDSAFRVNYPDVEVVLDLTTQAFRTFFQPQKIEIDYLHIDADHHYEGVKLDWDLYSPLVSGDGVITLHDTLNYRQPCGVPRLVEEIRREGRHGVINFPVGYGTAVLRRNPSGDESAAASGADLPAVPRRG